MISLITGGAGFIGSHLSEYLLKKGEEVHVIDNLSTGSMDNIRHLLKEPGFHCSTEDILNKSNTASIIGKCDHVYHLAASVGVKLVVENPLESLRNNIRGTEVILDLAIRNKTKVLITSSSEVYGRNDKLPFTETDDRVYGSVYSTRWGYAFSKSIDEFMSLAYYREEGLPTVVARLFNTVGPRQTDTYGMVIPRFVRQALSGRPLTVYGTGRQRRCFSDVMDVVGALYQLMQSDESIGDVYNIGSNNEISIIDLAKKIIELTRSSSKIIFVPYGDAYEENFEDMSRRVPNLDKIMNAIDYVPNNSLDNIIGRVIEFYKKENSN